MSQTDDELEELADELASGPLATRVGLLDDACRHVVPIRRAFVQAPSAPPHAPLAQLVSSRQHRALDAMLLLLAVEPILHQTPLHAVVWARALSPESGPAIAPASMSKTWADLERFGLVNRRGRINRLVDVIPLCEDGSGQVYSRPGRTAKGTTGYFGLPIAYWVDSWDQHLSLPGKAMLLVLLSATTRSPALNADYEQITARFGISERTARRGCAELERAQLMRVHGQLVAAPRSPNGVTTRHHRFLTGMFSQHNISNLRSTDAAAAKTKQETAPAAVPPPPPSSTAQPAVPAPPASVVPPPPPPSKSLFGDFLKDLEPNR